MEQKLSQDGWCRGAVFFPSVIRQLSRAGPRKQCPALHLEAGADTRPGQILPCSPASQLLPSPIRIPLAGSWLLLRGGGAEIPASSCRAAAGGPWAPQQPSPGSSTSSLQAGPAPTSVWPLHPPRPHPSLGCLPLSVVSLLPSPLSPSSCAVARGVISHPAAAPTSRLYQLEDLGCAAIVCSSCHQFLFISLQPAHPGGGWKVADSGQRAGELGFGHSRAQAQATCQPAQFQLIFACASSMTNTVFPGISSAGDATFFPGSASMPRFYCLVESPVVWAAGPGGTVKGKAEQGQD